MQKQEITVFNKFKKVINQLMSLENISLIQGSQLKKM